MYWLCQTSVLALLLLNCFDFVESAENPRYDPKNNKTTSGNATFPRNSTTTLPNNSTNKPNQPKPKPKNSTNPANPTKEVTWKPKDNSTTTLAYPTKETLKPEPPESKVNSTSSSVSKFWDGQKHIVIPVGAVLGLLIIITCVKFIVRRKYRDSDHEQSLNEDEDIFKNGARREVNVKKTELPMLIPYDTRLEISRKNIDLDTRSILGSGAFGKVVKGKIKGRTVAVKMLNNRPAYLHFKALLSELKILSYIGHHENIVELVGACTDHSSFRKMSVFLVFEFYSNGNAHTYIKLRRENFVNCKRDDRYVPIKVDQVAVYANGTTERFNSCNLVRWSYEVACGMEHIADRQIYHGDLAARNILLSSSLVAKIGDFGLSRQISSDYSVYVQREECPLPLKWMAIESLRDLEFSIESDVWSFGILMWEFFSLATVPYPGVDWNRDAWKLLSEGHRMDRPEHATSAIYDIMLSCWNAVPTDRPKFSDLVQILQSQVFQMQTATVHGLESDSIDSVGPQMSVAQLRNKFKCEAKSSRLTVSFVN